MYYEYDSDMWATDGDSRGQHILCYQIVLLGLSQKTHPEADRKALRMTEWGFLLPDFPLPCKGAGKGTREERTVQGYSSERAFTYQKAPVLSTV